MQWFVSVVGLAGIALLPAGTGIGAGSHSPHGDGAPLLFRSEPMVWTVAALGDEIDLATVTDVVVAELNGDGQPDLAVAWFATDLEDRLNNERGLTLFFGTHGTFEAGPTFDLFIPHAAVPALDVFRNGTGEMTVGDFDGDGDADLVVLAFFGDELWFIENLGDGTFAAYLRYPFGYNSTGNFITPPEAQAADFDGDGRDELVYLADPVLQYNQRIVHFWETSGSMAGMHRVYWEGEEQLFTQWTRGLAVADFDGDMLPDLCFSGCTDPGPENDPILTFWYGLDVTHRTFAVHQEFPTLRCADVVATQPNEACPPGVLLMGLDGLAVEYWAAACAGEMDFSLTAMENGYSGSPDRGMTGVMADVDGDGDLDLVTKQKAGAAGDVNQIEVTLCSDGGLTWTRVESAIDTTGFQVDPQSEILRPQNLVVADVFGNTLPEVIGGFGADEALQELRIAIWANSCLGDVTRDGRVTYDDVQALSQSEGFCEGHEYYNADADLDKSGCVTLTDAALLVADLNCGCSACEGQALADSNCDGDVNAQDLSAFLVACRSGQAAWEAEFGGCGCDYLCVNDIDGSGHVNAFDIGPLVQLLSYHALPDEQLQWRDP